MYLLKQMLQIHLKHVDNVVKYQLRPRNRWLKRQHCIPYTTIIRIDNIISTQEEDGVNRVRTPLSDQWLLSALSSRQSVGRKFLAISFQVASFKYVGFATSEHSTRSALHTEIVSPTTLHNALLSRHTWTHFFTLNLTHAPWVAIPY